MVSQEATTNLRPKFPLLGAQDQPWGLWWPFVLLVVCKNHAGPARAFGGTWVLRLPFLPTHPWSLPALKLPYLQIAQQIISERLRLEPRIYVCFPQSQGGCS